MKKIYLLKDNKIIKICQHSPLGPPYTYQNIPQVKLSLSTPRTHIWGAEIQLHSFLTSVIERGELPLSRPGHFTQRTQIPTDKKDGWAGWAPQQTWYSGEEKKSLASTGIQTPPFRSNITSSSLPLVHHTCRCVGTHLAQTFQHWCWWISMNT